MDEYINYVRRHIKSLGRHKKFLEHPLVIVLIAVITLIGFYYMISPYQQCLREVVEEDYFRDHVTNSVREKCNGITSW